MLVCISLLSDSHATPRLQLQSAGSCSSAAGTAASGASYKNPRQASFVSTFVTPDSHTCQWLPRRFAGQLWLIR